MNISRVLKYLISGVIIGAILFFAGFGIVNMMNDSGDEVTRSTPVVAPAPTEPATPAVEVTPPAIQVTSTNQNAASQTNATQADNAQNGATQTGQGTSTSPIKIKPLGSENSAETDVAIEETNQSPAFGTLTLSTVNAENGQATSADFLIQNSDGAAIAQVKNTESSTLSLPAGDYKITVSQGDAKLVRFLGVSEGQNGSEVFELDVPVLQEEAPEVIQVVTPTQTAPVSGGDETAQQQTQQQTTQTAQQASTEQSGDAQSRAEAAQSEELASEDPAADGVDQPAKEASTEVTVTNATTGTSTALGGLRVSALTKVGNRPTNASFYIQKLNGENIENVKGVSTQQFNLPAGKYRITARKGTARVVTEVTVVANRGMHEIFHIPEVPATTSTAATQQTPPRPAQTQPAATPAAPSRPAGAADSNTAKTGRLELFAQSASNNAAIKSNFYVQTVDGKLVTNKTYVDSIGYKLPPGKYKVTVRATGYEDKSVQLIVREGQVRREVFKMSTKRAAAPAAATPPSIPVIPAPSAPVTQAPAPQAPQAQTPAAPRPAQNQANRRGGLQVNIVSAETGQGLIADISVHRPDGTEIRRSNQTSKARFNLPPREFVIRINYGGLVTNQKVKIRRGKLAIRTITFKQSN